MRVLFSEFEAIIFRASDELLNQGDFVEHYIADLLVEVSAGITRGRTLFIQQKAKDKSDERLYDDTQIAALSRGMCWMNLLSSGKPSIAATKQCLDDLQFTRAVYESMLELFAEVVKDYPEQLLEAMEIRQQIEDGLEEEERYAGINQSLLLTERAAHINRYELYQLCQSIDQTFLELKSIRGKVMRPYLRLVFKIARGHSASEQQILDNFQNGATGLMRAVSYFDFHNYSNFSSYARWWVSQSILLLLKEQANFIRLPIGVWQNYNWLETVRSKITAEQGGCSTGVLAKETGYSIDQLHSIYEGVGTSNVCSLDYFIDQDEKVPLSSVIADETIKQPDELEVPITQYLSFLDDELRKIICLHHGLLEYVPRDPLSRLDIYKERLRQRWRSDVN